LAINALPGSLADTAETVNSRTKEKTIFFIKYPYKNSNKSGSIVAKGG